MNDNKNKTLEQLAETLFRQWFVEEAEEKREHANKLKREREALKKKELEVLRVENISN